MENKWTLWQNFNPRRIRARRQRQRKSMDDPFWSENWLMSKLLSGRNLFGVSWNGVGATAGLQMQPDDPNKTYEFHHTHTHTCATAIYNMLCMSCMLLHSPNRNIFSVIPQQKRYSALSKHRANISFAKAKSNWKLHAHTKDASMQIAI